MLVERARTSRVAFGELYDRYVDRVYRFCLAHSGTVERAADLTEETFIRALEAITCPEGQPGRYEGADSDVSSWLLCVAANAARDSQHRDLAPLNTPDAVPGASSPGDVHGDSPVDWRHVDPEVLAEDWEQLARLQAGLALLPATYQQVLRLRFWDGRGWTEVASRMGQAEGAVKRLGKLALSKLTVLLREDCRPFEVAGTEVSASQ
jgi:RNA polymerase sigma-70 factor (ECF subfamily)